jgi:hypothetical protein
MMFPQMDSLQKFGKDQMEAGTKMMGIFTEGMRTMASEGAEFSKRAFENNSAAMEKLSSARTVDALVDIQTKSMKQAYEDGVTCATRMGELWGNIVKEACKPYEGMYSTMSSFAQNLTPKSR